LGGVIPVEAFSVKTILDIRNDILFKFPQRHDLLNALELRSIKMLYTFGKYREKI
jgi:hypothetical protein